jgi:hypothetical protein
MSCTIFTPAGRQLSTTTRFDSATASSVSLHHQNDGLVASLHRVVQDALEIEAGPDVPNAELS